MSTPPVTVRCFSHLGITVSQLDTSIEFYTEVLGFVRRFEDVQDGWTRVGLAIGEILLELFSPPPEQRPGPAVDPFYPTKLGRQKIGAHRRRRRRDLPADGGPIDGVVLSERRDKPAWRRR